MPDHVSLPHLHTAWWEMCCPPSAPLTNSRGSSRLCKDPFFPFQSVLLFTLFSEPRVGEAQVGKLEENCKSLRNCRHVYFLQAGAAAKGVSQVGLIQVYRTKVVHGQISTS